MELFANCVNFIFIKLMVFSLVMHQAFIDPVPTIHFGHVGIKSMSVYFHISYVEFIRFAT